MRVWAGRLMVLGMGVIGRERRIDNGGEGAASMDDGQVLLWIQGPWIARRERDEYMRKMGEIGLLW